MFTMSRIRPRPLLLGGRPRRRQRLLLLCTLHAPHRRRLPFGIVDDRALSTIEELGDGVAAPALLALGGGGTFGLWIDRDCLRGASGACRTFGNPGPISATPNFDIVSVEIWDLSVERYGEHSSTQTHAFGNSSAKQPRSSHLSAETSKWATAPPPSRL